MNVSASPADGTMTEVSFARFGDWVVIDIDDAVEIECDGLGDGVKLLEVALAIGDIRR